MTTIKELLQQIQTYHPDPNEQVAFAMWTVEDIQEEAEQHGVKLTKEQAEEIIGKVDRHDDISWDTIEGFIDEYGEEEEEGAEEEGD